MKNKNGDLEKKYFAYYRRKILVIIILVISLGAMVLIALSLGSANLSPMDIFNALIGKGDSKTNTIVFMIRLPRILAAILVGATLSVSGAVVQCILRNPLGSPFTLGISPAASFGAAFAVIVLGAGSIHSAASDAVILDNSFIVTSSAFSWCLIGTLFVLVVIRYKGAKPEIIILLGMIVGSLFNAWTTSLEYFAEDVQLASIMHWTFGNLSRGNWEDILLITAIVVPSMLFFIFNSLNYNALDAGDDAARSLGVNYNKLRITSMIVASLSIAVVTAFYGIIAFVGLVVPHIVRKMLKSSDSRHVLPASALFGGVFVLIADTLARTIIAPLILPVGVLTSFLGAPMFLYFLVKRSQSSG
ncbi:MAG: FecCD family ABC transporter permease [Promethearchaeota archaeon]